MSIFGARLVGGAGLQAAIRQRVARKPVLAVERRKTCDAAVPRWVAARQSGVQAVVVHGALHALPIRAVRACRAGAERAARRRARRAACVASTAGRRAASLAAGASLASVVRRAGARRPAEGRAARTARGARSPSSSFDVEFEAPIAGRLGETEPNRGERGANPPLAACLAPPSHGSTKSLFASSTANPRG
jgi:hypothetical protein